MHHKLALFIDGPSLFYTAKATGVAIDYRKLLDRFGARGHLVRAFYYTTLADNQEFTNVRPLADWLSYNGFLVVTKSAKESADAAGRRRIRGGMNIELAVDAMEMAASVDQLVLFSGDGDFVPLVRAVQRKGVSLSVVSTILTQPAMVSDDLRRQADEFVEFAHIADSISREEVLRTPDVQDVPRRPIVEIRRSRTSAREIAGS